MSVDADPLEVYDDPVTVRAPDGQSYVIRVFPAGFGAGPLVPGGFGIGALAFALGWVVGRAWRVEIRQGEETSQSDGLLSAPPVAVVATTRGKRAAAIEARKAAESIRQHGWSGKRT